MTPEERQLVTGLFDRMRGFGSPEKDREAEAMISQSVRAMPDAPYMLVQSVLAQEHALQEAGKRIEDLEAQVRSLQGEGPPRAPAGSGSFLGGLLGGGRAASQPESSVPVIGSRAVPSGLGERQGWGGQPPPPQARRQRWRWLPALGDDDGGRRCGRHARRRCDKQHAGRQQHRDGRVRRCGHRDHGAADAARRGGSAGEGRAAAER